MTTSIQGQALTENQCNELRDRLLQAAETHTRAAHALCKLLFESYFATVKIGKKEMPLAEAWGHESWEEYVEHELGMHVGTAKSYVRVYDELIVRRGLQPEALPQSITKLRVLAKVSRKPDADIKEWVSKANAMGCCEFDAAADVERTGRERKRNIAFNMRWTEAGKTMARIKQAKESLGVETSGEALATIVEQWTDLHDKSVKARKRTG